MKKLINKFIQKLFIKDYKPSTHKDLNEYMYNIFRSNGEGIYYVNIWSRNNNFMAKIIGLFSDGISHTVPVVYSEDLWSKFDVVHTLKIQAYFNQFYGLSVKTLLPDIKCLCFSSDDIGQTVCDFSRYQNRKMSIRKCPDSINEKKVLDFLVAKLGRPYDSVGLIDWIFGLRDDPYSYYCSELTYDALAYGGIFISDKENPSPAQIEKYNPEWIVYKN